MEFIKTSFLHAEYISPACEIVVLNNDDCIICESPLYGDSGKAGGDTPIVIIDEDF